MKFFLKIWIPCKCWYFFRTEDVYSKEFLYLEGRILDYFYVIYQEGVFLVFHGQWQVQRIFSTCRALGGRATYWPRELINAACVVSPLKSQEHSVMLKSSVKLTFADKAKRNRTLPTIYSAHDTSLFPYILQNIKGKQTFFGDTKWENKVSWKVK